MLETERIIAADADRLWHLLGDLENWDRLLPTMRQVTRLGPQGPIAVGSRFRVRQPGLPRATYEITDWRPGTGFTWVSSSPAVRTTATHTLSGRDGGTRDGGTRLTLGIDWSGPLAGLARVLVGSRAARMLETEADTFVTLAQSDTQTR